MTSKFFKVNRFILKLMAYSLPLFVIECMYLFYLLQIKNVGLITPEWLNTLLGIFFMTWFVLTPYILTISIFNIETREYLLFKLFKIKERDEREEAILNNATRTSLLTGIVLSTLILFLTQLTFQIKKYTEAEALKHDNKKHSLSLGFDFKLLDKEIVTTDATGNIVTKKDIPLSKGGIILLILLVQTGTFIYGVRRDRI